MEIALVPHMIRKDLLHLRLLFGFWCFLLLAQGLLIGSSFTSFTSGTSESDTVGQLAYLVFTYGLPVLQGLILIILVPLLIQEDSPVGTTSFWLTRPMSRSMALLSKTAFIAGLLIVPLLIIEILVLALHGVAPRDILLTLCQDVLLGKIGLIFPIAALAVVTRTFAKFALWFAIMWISMTVGGFILLFFLKPDAYVAGAIDVSAAMSAGIASRSVSILGSILVILHQYFTRRTQLSVIILIATLAASLVIRTVWPYDFLKQPTSAANPALFTSESVQLALNKNRVFAHEAGILGGGPNPQTDLQGELRISHVPAGYQIEVGQVKSDLRFSDGTLITSVCSNNLHPLLSWWPDAISSALGGVAVRTPPTTPFFLTQILTVDTRQYQERKSQPGTLRSTLELKAQKLQMIGRVPLQPGKQIVDGSSSYEIAQVLRQTNGVHIVMRERKVNLWSNRRSNAVAEMARDNNAYVLVNFARKEAILPWQNNKQINFGVASDLLDNSLRFVNRNVTLPFTGGEGAQQFATIDDQWLAGAELVRLEAIPAGTLQRELTVTDFLMSPKP